MSGQVDRTECALEAELTRDLCRKRKQRPVDDIICTDYWFWNCRSERVVETKRGKFSTVTRREDGDDGD
jgi:hypothetical protein